MSTAIFVLWWIFLVLALLITVADVYLLVRAVLLARSIRSLSATTLAAAAGIAANTNAGEPLTRTVKLVQALAPKTEAVARLTGQLGALLAGGK